MRRMQIEPWPTDRLGAHWDGQGTVFAIASAVAEAVELCIFDGDDEHRLELPTRTGPIHSGRVAGAGPGTRYGFRVQGPWAPHEGHRCNPHKLLLDPYARRIDGSVRWSPALLGHTAGRPETMSRLDSAPFVPRSIVTSNEFDWGDDHRPGLPLADSILYETHVKGMTKTHPGVPEHLRGSYAGMASDANIEHLMALGVTAVELMPIHHFVQDQHLLATGRRNYWGYNSIGFFAPHREYAAGEDPVAEFKSMVKRLHAAGIEVILDVVYNHTAEGNPMGPTLCFRGLDNRAWYRLEPGDRYWNLDWSGTGNTVDLSSPVALRLVMDSLRYWVEEMHVDGFRFDLATALGRTAIDFDPLGGFFGAMSQDPVLQGVKLIAEPWDVGPSGYRVGGFPPGWSELNDKYRDEVRDFWRGSEDILGSFATRLTGSSDIYGKPGRSPIASVNYVASHDGFTLADVVSYNERHNLANGENNRDGHPDNRSWNGGVEGPTDDAEINAVRDTRRRSLLATLLISQGVPLVLGGDEIGRTQRGNNNAYNQDNEISWFSWEDADLSFLDFARRMIAFRRSHPSVRRTAWLHEHAAPGIDHVGWFTPAGEEMTQLDWSSPLARSVAIYLDGQIIHCAAGTVSDDDLLIMFNGYREPIEFSIPEDVGLSGWRVAFDTAAPGEGDRPVRSTSAEIAGFAMVGLFRPRS